MSFLSKRMRADRLTESTEIFPPLDVEALARDLRLKARGEERGARNLPGRDDRGRDSVEHEVIDAVGRLRSLGIAQYETHMRVYGDRLRNAQAGRVEIEQAAGGAEVKLKRLIKEHEAHLASVRDEAKKTGASFQTFAKKNRLDGIPQDGSGWTKFVAVAVVLVVLESMGNALLFGEASHQGLLGGFFIAGMVSLLNVGTATAFTRLARYSIHRNVAKKLFGVIAGSAGLALVALINLGAAHFRDATERVGEITASAQAGLTSLLTAPFDLDSLQSWGLFGLGLMFAVVAAAKAIAIDDAYPGFATKWQAVAGARKRYADDLSSAFEDIEETVRQSIEGLVEESDKARRRIDALLDGSGNQASVTAQLPSFLGACDRAASHLLAIYRDANRAARSEAAPEGFGEPYAFPTHTGTPIDADAMREIRAERDAIRQIVDDATRRIHMAAEQAVEKYPTVEEMEREALGATAVASIVAPPSDHMSAVRLDPRPPRIVPSTVSEFESEPASTSAGRHTSSLPAVRG